MRGERREGRGERRKKVVGIDWSFTIAATAKLFIPPIFENKKRACGYWF